MFPPCFLRGWLLALLLPAALHAQDGKVVSFGPIDGGYGEVLALTRELFSKDAFLAKFSEKAFRERAGRLRAAKP